VPKDQWDFAPASEWPAVWVGNLQMSLDSLTEKKISSFMAWLPYILLALVLVLSRTIKPLGDALKTIDLKFVDILGEQGISGNFQVLYLPGGLLILVCIATYFLHQMRISDFGRAIRDSGSTIVGAGFVLIFTVPMVRVMINSGVNAYELASMPIAMARGVADLMGQIYPLFAPTVGALGAFLAGSNTVSNLMLSQFQFESAGLLGLSGALMVAIQSVGAAAGNMIAIHNVVAASATVGLLGREGVTLRITIIPTIYYLVLAGVLGMLAFHVVGVTDPLIGVLSATPIPK
jgi:lactate permease